MVHLAGYTAIASHRSGETEDTTIVDLVVAKLTLAKSKQKPSRTDRCKIQPALRIEELRQSTVLGIRLKFLL